MKSAFLELIEMGTKFLSKSGVKLARFETMILAEKTLNLEKLEFFTNSEIQVNKNQKKKFLQRIVKRSKGKPISKICGKKEFFSNEFFVNNDVLDPRPESELIVNVIKNITDRYSNKKLRVLELGVGSGCLLISIFLELKNFNLSGIGVDISERALVVTKKNIDKFELQKKISLRKSNWFSNVSEKFDIIISNPPYIETSKIYKLQKDVRDYDPYIALNGGFDGLKSYKEIASKAKKFIKKDGILCFEIGQGQCEHVNCILKKSGFKSIYKEKDLQGIDRVVVYKLN